MDCRQLLRFRALAAPGFVPLGVIHNERSELLEVLQDTIECRWQDGDLKGASDNPLHNRCDPKWRPVLGESEWEPLQRKYAWTFDWVGGLGREDDGYYCDVKAYRCDKSHTTADGFGRLIISEAFLCKVSSELGIEFLFGLSAIDYDVNAVENEQDVREVRDDSTILTSRDIRTRQIQRFRDSQQRRRRWLSLWEIADWIACDRGKTDRRDEQLRAQGYHDLLTAILAGEFDHQGRTCVLHLSPWGQKPRLSVEWLRQMRDLYAGQPTLNEQVLSRCWIPHKLARRWFERRNIEWSRCFDPIAEASTVLVPPNPERHSEQPLEWIKKSYQLGVSKYDTILKDCHEATGATFREIKAALGSYKERRKRGRPSLRTKLNPEK